MDETRSPLDEAPFVDELGEVLRSAVERARTELPPAYSLARSLARARRLGPGRANPWLRYHRTATATAVAAVLFLAFALLLICWRYEPAVDGQAAQGRGNRSTSWSPGNGEQNVAVLLDHGPSGGRNDGFGLGHTEEPFQDAARNPVSNFPLSVDATAYAEVRRALLDEKRLPTADTVRVAGLINSFTYSYPEPAKGEAASLTLDIAQCPWNSADYLARIGIRARPDAPIHEAEVLVAFNARHVSAYRLIGYEGRRTREPDAVGDTLGAGQVVTALYEIAPEYNGDRNEWLWDEAEWWLAVKMRYGEANRQLSRSLTGPAKKLAEAPADFRFAAAAAEFGLLLRGSPYRGDATYEAVRIAARGARGADPDGRRAEFLAMVDAADHLHSARTLFSRDAKGS